MEEKQKISSFTDLDAWKEGHKLVLMVYNITRTFPKEEVFALVSQMRRCVVSITSNIAEGFSRQSFKEKVQFYYISQGSLTELQNQLLIARDVEFVTKKDFLPIAEQTVKVQRITNGLIKKSKSYS
ncbi:MAG: hypothetical protein A3E38_02825 [Candidatus Moranbacteria bacterium RIFCSPHIGHO2_12_FULL_54_9]|nr:MAG: hypothetical protein A2878_00135 [Candidatus Moranbacteria bacterium RIFCSPHIGHO2_01_FULL_54_31]OGI26031.1 MAG: hypothetical protein A3E38_02825 [Candidatus Moranbacteria bacterium RIFCSPHIGHO2_12_FULL_54_9]